MELNYLAFAVPVFSGLMLLEYILSKRRQSELFHFEEAVANINVGIAERLSDVFAAGAFYFFFHWIYEHLAIFHFKSSPFTWVFLFLLTDLMWYWYHRFGHEVNIFWATHVVHHQSDDYNFTVSARITVFQAFARCIFWAVLPLVGFPPSMVTVLLLIHGAYPFFTHTQLVGKLGWLEYVFVTPSHHRVHHASNPQYLDKNYGDVLIIWDKIFGTFAEEKGQPVYGLTKPLNSYSFLWQHFHFFLELIISFNLAVGFRQKMKVLFGKPDVIDPRIRLRLERKLSTRVINNPAITRPLKAYIRFQTISTLILLFCLILFEKNFAAWQLLLAAGFIVVSLVNTGAMLEQRRWIFYLEYIRLAIVEIGCYFLYPNYGMFVTLSLLFGVLLLFYRSLSNRYYQYLFNYY